MLHLKAVIQALGLFISSLSSSDLQLSMSNLRTCHLFQYEACSPSHPVIERCSECNAEVLCFQDLLSNILSLVSHCRNASIYCSSVITKNYLLTTSKNDSSFMPAKVFLYILDESLRIKLSFANIMLDYLITAGNLHLISTWIHFYGKMPYICSFPFFRQYEWYILYVEAKCI